MSGFPEGERVFAPQLSTAVGYGSVVGIGFAFALFMLVMTRLQKRFTSMDPQTAGEFLAASRSVKPGLICCGIVSAWTWSATLLQSSVGAYSSGLSCAWWYAVGGTIQIAFFAVMATKVKMNANGAVTYLQIVQRRYGTACHLMMTAAALICAHIVTGSLVLGCASTINALTGANIIACNFLLPIGIAVYVLLGGLRATFLVDYLHTVILFIIIYYFLFHTYGTSDLIGSPGKLYDLLKDAALAVPVEGNHQGSYLTMKSNSGLLFAASTIATGFSGVFLDQGYWQRAIASRPESTTKAYFLGAISWASIPFAFGSVMGLSCRALMNNPSFPTFPYQLSPSQVSAGLVAPAAAVTLLGKAGSVAMLIVVFMAATSACSAELIAVSSIVTFDIIGSYRKKKLTAVQSLRVSEIAIAGYAIWSGAFATILHVAGIDLGWLFYVQGVILTPAVFPVASTVAWSKASKAAILGGTIFGMVCAMSAWFITCWKVYGVIDIPNLAKPYSAVAGASAGLVISTFTTIIITLIRPDNYDWSGTRAITMVGDEASIKSRIHDVTSSPELDSSSDKKELDSSEGIQQTPALVDEDDESSQVADDGEIDRPALEKVFKRASWASGLLAIVMTFLIPLPLYFSHYIFSRRFFEVWIGISIVWVLVAGFFCIILPVYESKREMFLIARGAIRAMSGRGSSKSVVA